MNRPTELIEINVREKNPLKQRRSLIYLFTIAQLLYGFNFGFFNPKSKIKIYATKLMMIFMAFVMLIMLIVRFESVGLGRRWIIIYIVQYLPTFITLFFSTHSLCEFLTDMIIILDKQSKDSTFNTVGPIACLYLTVTFVIKTAAACFFFWSVLPILTEIPWMGLDVISVANFVLFYLVFVCMKNLKEELGGQEISAERFNMTYEAIADSFEKFRKSYDGIFIWSFLAGCFKWMAMIWDHLFYIHSSYSWWELGLSFVFAFHLTKQIIAPAVCAEMINVEIDAIKMILRKRCFIETAGAVSTEWARSLRYVEARPLLRKAWRLVPVDLRQPVTMFSMCITYLIVIIQFTHLYE